MSGYNIRLFAKCPRLTKEAVCYKIIFACLGHRGVAQFGRAPRSGCENIRWMFSGNGSSAAARE